MRCVSLAVAVVLALCVPAFADVYVTISKSQQQMVVSIDGGPTYRWPVSTGRPGYNTPSGRFSAIRLARVYYSKKYDDAPMPNSVFFYGGYAIHGTYEERKLGNAVSHGCVRLSRAHAAVLYAAVQAHGMSRTHIRITDAPIGDGPPVVARGDDGPRYRNDERRPRETYAARARRAAPVYRGFETFGTPRYREPPPQVYWDDPRWRWVERDNWRRY